VECPLAGVLHLELLGPVALEVDGVDQNKPRFKKKTLKIENFYQE
jgi:hypothetical protein